MMLRERELQFDLSLLSNLSFPGVLFADYDFSSPRGWTQPISIITIVIVTAYNHSHQNDWVYITDKPFIVMYCTFYLTLYKRPLALPCKIIFAFEFQILEFSNSKTYLMNYWINTRHVCTYFDLFRMLITNILMLGIFNEIFETFYYIYKMSCAHARCVENVKTGLTVTTHDPLFLHRE